MEIEKAGTRFLGCFPRRSRTAKTGIESLTRALPRRAAAFSIEQRLSGAA
ncbi:hypothetical protein [Sorangium sp. So ce861]